MSRLPVIAGVCLVLGVLTNVVVAWGIGVAVDPSSVMRTARRGTGFETSADTVPRQTRSYYTMGLAHAHGLSARLWDAVYEPAPAVGGTDPRYSSRYAGSGVFEIRYGWPARSMRLWRPFFEMDLTANPARLAAIDMDSAWIIGWPAPWERNPFTPRRIPLEPLWAGSAVNTAFYGGLIWLAGFGPFVLRRAIRRRSGRCLHCGYDLARLDRCPECGTERTSGAAPSTSTRA